MKFRKMTAEDVDEIIALGEITSVSQIHMTCSHHKKNNCLDDIFIPLPLMLEWICDEGWKPEHTINTNMFIFKRINQANQIKTPKYFDDDTEDGTI